MYMHKLHIRLIHQIAGSYPLLLVPNEANDDEARAPPLKLSHPVGERGLWYNDDVGASDVPHQTHVAKQSYSLQRLAKTLIIHRKWNTCQGFKKDFWFGEGSYDICEGGG